MSSINLSYPLYKQQYSSAERAKEAVKLAYALGFGKEVAHSERNFNPVDEKKIPFPGEGKDWG